MLTDLSMWLIELTLKTTILLALAVVADRLLRVAPARVRYRMWTATVLGVLALPTLAVVTPEWRIPLLPAPAAKIGGEIDGAATSAPPSNDSRTALNGQTELAGAPPETSRTRQYGEIAYRVLPIQALPSSVPSMVGPTGKSDTPTAAERLARTGLAASSRTRSSLDGESSRAAASPAAGTTQGAIPDTTRREGPWRWASAIPWSTILVTTWLVGVLAMAISLMTA